MDDSFLTDTPSRFQPLDEFLDRVSLDEVDDERKFLDYGQPRVLSGIIAKGIHMESYPIRQSIRERDRVSKMLHLLNGVGDIDGLC